VSHADQMAQRLHPLYRQGELVEGVLNQPAVQLEILDEYALEVQRAHFFDQTLDLAEAAKLAALLDIAPESWQNLGEFRAWFHALRNALLRDGAVTRTALQNFVIDYTRRFQEAVKTQVIPDPRKLKWLTTPLGTRQTFAAFIENPPLRRYVRAPGAGGIEPLHQFQVEMRGLDEPYASFLLTGLPAAPESVPFIVNLTSGQALYFLGQVPPGARLWLRATPDGKVTGNLEGVDVTDKLRSLENVVPGQTWNTADVQQPAKAIKLRRASNDIWFLPVAHFDVLGLDRFLLALADLLLQQGRYDQTNFDQALFYQEPALIFRMTWVEEQPAKFEIQLPAGALRSKTVPGNEPETKELREAALLDREQLDFSLNKGVGKLKAAGVVPNVKLCAFSEIQGQLDRISNRLPQTVREIAPSGADKLPDAGGVFEITGFDNSTFR
jgi:hypothetical protein